MCWTTCMPNIARIHAIITHQRRWLCSEAMRVRHVGWRPLLWPSSVYLGADSLKRYHLTTIGNPIVEIRRSYDRLISTMGFPILTRWHLYIESGPWCVIVTSRCITFSNIISLDWESTLSKQEFFYYIKWTLMFEMSKMYIISMKIRFAISHLKRFKQLWVVKILQETLLWVDIQADISKGQSRGVLKFGCKLWFQNLSLL